MTERDYAPLSNACVRGLCDKIYEKRKFAAVEIEKMVKDFSDANNTNQIKRLIKVLGQDLMSSTNPNVKNGALLGLSSVAVALGKASIEYTGELTHPIMACLGESEARVRYMATEALFNVLKIGRAAALPNFPIIFDALAKLAADPEPQVKQGAELLDRLVKDIVTESDTFDVASFVPLVRERMYTRSASARQFVVSWVCAMDAAPALGLRQHLPHLLDGLFTILDDPNPEIRRMCEVQLNEFLRSIKKSPSQVDFQAMINILITHAQSTEELLQLTAITWMKEFVGLSGPGMLPCASGILRAVLPCLAYTDDSRKKIREIAATVNLQLTKLIGPDVTDATDPTDSSRTEQVLPEVGVPPDDRKVTAGDTGVSIPGDRSDEEDEEMLNLEAVVEVLTQMLLHNSVHTKVAALDWILHLYNKMPNQMFALTDAVFSRAMGALSDATDEVVLGAIAVLAEICSCQAPSAPAAPGAAPAAPAPAREHNDLESNPYYYKFLKALLRLLAADDNLLEDRGAFIIRELCVVLPAEAVYRALADTLAGERDVRFAARLVDVLSALLLTAPELHATRRRLRAFDHKSTHALFKSLYWCWCHSPVALVALCLLTHNYTHCNKLIATFGDLEITVDLLTEVDKLVQLIESPIFAYLRLELLSGAESAALRGALFGLLMLLPQSSAFHALRHRLRTAPRDAPYLLREERASPVRADIEFEPLLQHFRRVQAQHRDFRAGERRVSRARLAL